MAHSVGEQAARAVKNSERKKIEETRTPEQRLASIRNNRAAKLFVTPDDQDFLLGAFDAEKEFSHKLAEENMALKALVANMAAATVIEAAKDFEIPYVAEEGGED